jgi:hypothetical protein
MFENVCLAKVRGPYGKAWPIPVWQVQGGVGQIAAVHVGWFPELPCHEGHPIAAV